MRRSATQQPPLGVRLVYSVRKEPDYRTLTPTQLAALGEAANRVVNSRFARLLTGIPHSGVTIGWRAVELAHRTIRVRVYRPKDSAARNLPLVLHIHGGGYVGSAVQCDWINSHMAARASALVVSVEHRLMDHETPLAAIVDDGWDVLRHLLRHADEWDIDRSRVAVAGESAGSMVAALSALRARDAGMSLRAQVLVNPCVDVTPGALDYESARQYPDTPTLTNEAMEFFCELAVPEGTDPRTVSPLYAGDLAGLPPTLAVIPVLDPVADHGRVYAEHLRAAGTVVEVSEHPGAGHAFISMPGLVPQARPARDRIVDFLRGRLR